MTKLRVSQQVEDFVKSKAPEPRQRLRKAIKGLADGEGDIKLLEGPLQGYYRLRIGGWRILYVERFEEGTQIIYCLFAEERGVVYELFTKLLAKGLVD